MNGELDIPASAFEVKANYFERPDKSLVALIRQFIHQFGTPHLWWGHTHNKPPAGSRVTFLGKYSLPATHHRHEKWAPCPCCTPRRPKYFRQGLIAWFPDEGVIRCVGDKCYKTLDPEGYRLAMQQLESEIAAERTAEYLLSRLPRIPGYILTIEASIPVVGAIDTMRNWMNFTVTTSLGEDLWSEARTGLLRTTIMRPALVVKANKDEVFELVPDFQDYGRLGGYIALRPGNSNMKGTLEQRREQLAAIDFGDEVEKRLSAFTEVEKKKVAQILSFAHDKAVKLITQAIEVRRFFEKVNLNTVNGWAGQPNCPVRVHFRSSDEGLFIGRTKDDQGFFKAWPSDFWTMLPTIEPLSKAEAA